MAPAWTVALAAVAVAGIAAFLWSQRRVTASDVAAGPVPQPPAGRRAGRDVHDDLRHLRPAAGEQLCVPTTTRRERIGDRAVVPADAADLSGPHSCGQRAGPSHRSAAADDGRVGPDGRGPAALCRGGTARRHVAARAVVRAGRRGSGAQHRPRRRAGDVGGAGAAGRPGLRRGESGPLVGITVGVAVLGSAMAAVGAPRVRESRPCWAVLVQLVGAAVALRWARTEAPAPTQKEVCHA